MVLSASLVEDTGFVWRKTWLFLVRERSLIVEEEVGSLTSGSKQGFGKFQREEGTLGVFCHKFLGLT